MPPWFDDAGFRRSRKIAYRASYPRGGDPWAVAEDRRLERARSKIAALPVSRRYDAWRRLAKQLGRTREAIRSRMTVLAAARRLITGKDL
jgi:hypothetical protein